MSMILLLHIAIALSSLVVTALAFVSPKQSLLYTSYALVALTISSGTYIAVISPAHMVQACISGLIYTVVVMGGIVAVRRKLAVDH